MRFGDRYKGSVVHESVAMLMEAGESRDKLLVVEGEFWVEKGDDMSGRNALETEMRRRAGSKSTVRVCVEHDDEWICLDRDSWAAVRLRATPMGRPHLGQCQSGALAAEVVCAGCGS